MRLHALREHFRSALENPYSSFYRSFYGARIPSRDTFPETEAEWESIPLLAKSDIMAVPFRKRVFIPFSHVDVIRITSGTTATGVLTVPRNNLQPIPELARIGPRPRVLSFFYPHHIHGFFDERAVAFVLGGDAMHLEASARLAARGKVTVIQGMPSLILAFAPVLAAVYDTARIEWLQLTAERCSVMQGAALRRAYPRARFIIGYASSELQGWGAISPEEPHPDAMYAVRSRDGYLFELIDENGMVRHEPGARGELAVTTHTVGSAFPLIRYRTGDRAEQVARDESGMTFSLLGRVDGDRVRIAGGVLLAEELERAIGKVGADAVVDFEADVDEVGSPPMPRLTVRVATTTPVVDLSTLERSLAEELRLSQNRSYADLAKLGLCAPLSCIPDLKREFTRKSRALRDKRV